MTAPAHKCAGVKEETMYGTGVVICRSLYVVYGFIK